MSIRPLCVVPRGAFIVLSTLLPEGCAPDPNTNSTFQYAVTTQGAPDSGLQNKLDTDTGYVLVPNVGLVPRSCVHEIPNHAHVDLNNNVFVNDRLVAHYEPCAYPIRRQMPVSGSSMQDGWRIPTIDGWVEYFRQQTSSSFCSLDSRFTVPPAPSNYHGQTIYIFPALEPSMSGAILQPVLMYGTNGLYGGEYWTYTSWYISGSNIYYNNPIDVNEYDSLIGWIAQRPISWCYTNVGSCWELMAYDSNIYYGSGAYFNTPDSEIYDLSFPIVLEAYGVTSCSDFPSNPVYASSSTAHTFSGSGACDANESSNIDAIINSGLSPSCQYLASENSWGGFTLGY
jgi:hypothetical protein